MGLRGALGVCPFTFLVVSETNMTVTVTVTVRSVALHYNYDEWLLKDERR